MEFDDDPVNATIRAVVAAEGRVLCYNPEQIITHADEEDRKNCQVCVNTMELANAIRAQRESSL